MTEYIYGVRASRNYGTGKVTLVAIKLPIVKKSEKLVVTRHLNYYFDYKTHHKLADVDLDPIAAKERFIANARRDIEKAEEKLAALKQNLELASALTPDSFQNEEE